MDIITDPAAPGSVDPTATPATPEAPKATYTKDDLTRIVKREVGTVATERDELKARLTELETRAKEAEDAKLSATQRAENDRKRENDRRDAELKSALALASSERSKRHVAMCAGRAASLVSSVAAKLFNPRLAPHVEAIVRERLVVEDDGAGGERIAIRLGAPGDTEPVETGWPKLVDANLVDFFAASGGAGAQHGGGAAPSPASLANLSPAERIELGLRQQRGK